MDNINEEFISCVKTCDIGAITALLESGADVHIGNDYALRWSAEDGNSNMVTKLLECGADPDVNAGAVLRCAIINGERDIVTKLLAFDANVNARGCHSALELGVGHNNLSIVKVLLKYGADVHSDDDFALRMSIQHCRFKIARVLLKNGANVRCDNKSILQKLLLDFNKRLADVILPYCESNDYEYFPADYIRARLVPIKSANSA